MKSGTNDVRDSGKLFICVSKDLAASPSLSLSLKTEWWLMLATFQAAIYMSALGGRGTGLNQRIPTCRAIPDTLSLSPSVTLYPDSDWGTTWTLTHSVSEKGLWEHIAGNWKRTPLLIPQLYPMGFTARRHRCLYKLHKELLEIMWMAMTDLCWSNWLVYYHRLYTAWIRPSHAKCREGAALRCCSDVSPLKGHPCLAADV